jgi:hypothetical protein
MISTLVRFGRRIAFSLFLLAGTTFAYAADPVFLPGFRVGLVPAPGLKPTPEVNGFEDRFANVRVVILELPAGLHSSLTDKFGPTGLQRLGATVETYEAFRVSDGDGYLAKGRVAAGRVQIWSLVFTSTDLAAAVLVNIPEAASHKYGDSAVRTLLSSVAVRGKLSIEDQVSGLRYRIGDQAGFRMLGMTAGGALATLTEGAIDEVVDIEQPVLVIAHNPKSLGPSELSKEGNRLIAGLRPVTDLETLQSGPLSAKQCNGWETVAAFKAARNGAPGMAVAWICPFRIRTLELLGSAQKDIWSSVLPRFQKVRDSIQ